LEKEKSGGRRSKDIDIKYGSGGMLDVYFAVRFLQLRDNVPDSSDDRSTEFTLGELKHRGSLSEADFEILSSGYRFLASLDHNLRLTVGRTTRLPLANLNALEKSAAKMHLDSVSDLLETLTMHRLNVRKAFEDIVG
jgi:glutamine synthetase adenylyltransferase